MHKSLYRLTYITDLFLTFKETDKLFFKVPRTFCILTRSAREFQLLHILAKTWYVNSFTFGHYTGSVVVLYCGFN